MILVNFYRFREPFIRQRHLDNLKSRLGDKIDIDKVISGEQDIPIAACFVYHDVLELEESIQIISDLLVSKDGIVGSKRSEDESQFVKLYVSSPDLGNSAQIPSRFKSLLISSFWYEPQYHIVWVNDFPIKRFGQGIFKLFLENAYKAVHGYAPELNVYGKPSLQTFEYAKKVCQQQAAKNGLEISGYYMIGDNPACDIRGARNIGWKSILVKTGVYQPEDGQDNDYDDPADYVVYDFQEAIDLILASEGVHAKRHFGVW